MESFEERLRRFVNGAPEEFALTLVNSIANFLVPQIRVAADHELHELVFLGTHSIMQTVGEKILGKTGPEATRSYLESLVDGDTDDTRFSLISDDLHEMRNVTAHQWMSRRTHCIALDCKMAEGWKRAVDLHINPTVFAQHFLRGFGPGGKIYLLHRKMVTKRDLVLRKYDFVRDWLDLKSKDPIATEIKQLAALTAEPDLQAQEAKVRQLIFERYGIK